MLKENQDHIEKVKNKFEEYRQKSEQIILEANKKLQVEIDGHLNIIIRNAALDQGIATENERSQLVNFVIKYQQLPEVDVIDLIEKDGRVFIENLETVKNVINTFRPIIWNQKDSVYYKRIYKYCSSKLACKDPTIQTTLTVIREQKEDITDLYSTYLKNHCAAIDLILSKTEFDYLYNGVLQHSDKRFSERLIKDYYSGDLNYILAQHAYLLGPVKQLLEPFFVCTRMLYPDLRLGSLN